MTYQEPTIVKTVETANMKAKLWKCPSAPASRRWQVAYFKPDAWEASFIEEFSYKSDAMSQINWWSERF